MLSVIVQRIVIDGLAVSIVLGVLVMWSLWYNPRLWLQDYPKVVQAKVPPASPQEKLHQRLMMIPFLLLLLGAPYLSAQLVKTANGGTLPFVMAYVTVAGILQVFNLFDAVVLDYLILTQLKPAFAIIPGTTREESLVVGLDFQLRNFLKGIVICAVISLPIAFAASL